MKKNFLVLATFLYLSIISFATFAVTPLVINNSSALATTVKFTATLNRSITTGNSV
jgi:hypothetical protein